LIFMIFCLKHFGAQMLNLTYEKIIYANG